MRREYIDVSYSCMPILLFLSPGFVQHLPTKKYLENAHSISFVYNNTTEIYKKT